jgi:heptosyltransferase-2
MHVASGVGTPYVALFGPSPVPRFAPLVGKGLPLMHPVECGPCHQFTCRNTGDDYQKCLKLITPEEVVRAALRYLSPLSPAMPATPRPQAEPAHV